MSQSNLNSFFSQRKLKGVREGHPSKRRKLDGTFGKMSVTNSLPLDKLKKSSLSVEVGLQDDTMSKSQPPSTPNSGPAQANQVQVLSLQSETVGSTQMTESEEKSATHFTKIGCRSSKPKSSVRFKGRNNNIDSKQQKLTTFIASTPRLSLSAESDLPKSKSVSLVQESPQSDVTKTSESKIEDDKFTEVVTSVLDDHDRSIKSLCKEGMSTPRKKIITVEDTLSQGPVSRKRKSAVRKLIKIDVSKSEYKNKNMEFHKKLDMCTDLTSSSPDSEQVSGKSFKIGRGCPYGTSMSRHNVIYT